jgi:hypothetical protein
LVALREDFILVKNFEINLPICIFIFCTSAAQNVLPLDTLKLKEAKDMLADDYGNLYIYKNKDLALQI